ncbi:DUF3566 domain-containing protein [Corynebacterium epidermidicanis]|uniref:DUF3566 domain-containing protein n=1 Tax=Corynebacterium epidermidicanis TaxID=1050174 RepID=A0A0G3GQS8_9CORY|nr:DUF3566 domain-containing protein [Corynebacterium epidermidicanis]AKK01913.1 Transmembrane domain of unknown function (DUF3566) [Corynebacterium epidermidicanis]
MAAKQMTVQHVSVGSAFRTALVLSLAGLIAWMICVILLYLGMAQAGVWDSLNSVIGGAGGEGTISFKVVMSFAGLLGAIMAVLISVLAPLGAVIYNATVDLFGGLVVTLRDDLD